VFGFVHWQHVQAAVRRRGQLHVRQQLHLPGGGMSALSLARASTLGQESAALAAKKWTWIGNDDEVTDGRRSIS
jgi:hypothetical protein